MTPKRRGTLLGTSLGALWAIGVVWIGVAVVNLPVFSLLPTLAFAFLWPGLALLLVIARIAQRRLFDDELIGGDAPVPGSGAEIDRRVLQNTLEQAVLALLLWPPIAYLAVEDGPGLVLTLGVAFAIARLFFWVGYHVSHPMRAFGFGATFYPTVLALLWAIFSAYGFATGLAGG